jgi:hypothetical protein
VGNVPRWRINRRQDLWAEFYLPGNAWHPWVPGLFETSRGLVEVETIRKVAGGGGGVSVGRRSSGCDAKQTEGSLNEFQNAAEIVYLVARPTIRGTRKPYS